MKEVAYVSLVFGVFGVILMIAAPFLTSAASMYDCDNSTYLVNNYGHDGDDEYQTCNNDKAASEARGSVSYAVGYPLVLLSIILMIGANKFKDK